MTNVELNWEDPFPSFMRHCKKSQNYPVPASTWCVWVLALHFLVTDGSQNWQARKDVKDQNHPDNRTRCNDLGNISIGGYKVTRCVISVRFVSVNKL